MARPCSATAASSASKAGRRASSSSTRADVAAGPVLQLQATCVRRESSSTAASPVALDTGQRIGVGSQPLTPPAAPGPWTARSLGLRAWLRVWPGTPTRPSRGQIRGLRGGGGPTPGLLERGAGGAGTPRTQPPAGGPEAVARSGDHHGARVGQGHVDRLGPVARHHGGAHQGVEQLVDARADAADVGPHALAARRRRNGRPRRAQRHHGSGGVAGPQLGQGPAAGVDRGHHHRGDGLARRRLEGVLPPRVHLHHVEQRAHHTVDRGEPLGTGAGPGLVERQRERVGPGRPGVAFGLGLAAGLVGRFERQLGITAGGLGPVQVGRGRGRPGRGIQPGGRGGGAGPAEPVRESLRLGGQSGQPLASSASSRPRPRPASASLRSTPARTAASSPRTSAAAPVTTGAPSAHSRVKSWRAATRSASARARSSARGSSSAAAASTPARASVTRAASDSSEATTSWSTETSRSRSMPRRRSASTASRPCAFSRSDSKRTRASPR
jgi:hypothetical protein